MTISFGQLAGIAAGVLNTLAIIPYTISVVRGHTRPARASWIIWSVVGAIAAWSYHAVGARATIWFALTYATNPVIVLALSLKYGTGGWTRFDQRCLLGALASLALWGLSHSPAVGLVAILAVDALGALPTVKKVWAMPRSEDPLAWILCSAGGVVNLFALERWTFGLAFQPVYSLVATAFITLLICRVWWPGQGPKPARSDAPGTRAYAARRSIRSKSSTGSAAAPGASLPPTHEKYRLPAASGKY